MKNLFFTSLLALIVQALCAQDVIDIAEARTMPEGSVVTVTGTVTNGQELGNIRYYQDATGGFAAFAPAFSTVSRHDSITLTGTISFFNGLMQLSPVSEIINHGAAVLPIEPTPVSLGEISEATESTLVLVEACVFADGGSNFAGNSTYNITSMGEDGLVYLRVDNPMVGDLIPVSPVDIVAVSSQFSFSGVGGYQLLPRDENDFTSPNPINIVSAIGIENLSENGFTLSWVTDVPATSECYYTSNIDGDGLTDNSFTSAASTALHSITLNALEPGEVYFTRIFSVAGTDTAFSSVIAVATVSTSSGTIEAFFNGSVAHEVAEPDDNLATTANLRSKVIEVIGMAQNTLDIAAYNINDNNIVNALNQAHINGVQVRFIGEGQNANLGLNNLNSEIPILLRGDGQGSGMHNKYLVVDAASMDNSYVLAGSTNFTENQLDFDFNNIVVVQDRSLSKAYTIEFNEMWGSSSNTPNEALSRFGPDKVNNTPKQFVIGGKNVELYFSPSDGTTNGIIQALNTTNASVEFALLVFTVAAIADVLIDLNNSFFINVRGMIDQVNTTGSEFEHLTENLVPVLEHDFPQVQLHHKYAIVDRANLNSDPLVITGSHNWSASANNVNDENMLVIHDANITNQFYQEWTARWQGITVGSIEAEVTDFRMFPNPANDLLNLEFNAPAGINNRIQITDISGRLVLDYTYGTPAGMNNLQLDVRNLPNGVYVLGISGQWGGMTKKLVVAR
jgi:phosphatidylserine/phosphatidylglycerophosphate/cardiolipin synthase-like enzyme